MIHPLQVQPAYFQWLANTEYKDLAPLPQTWQSWRTFPASEPLSGKRAKAFAVKALQPNFSLNPTPLPSFFHSCGSEKHYKQISIFESVFPENLAYVTMEEP